MSGGTQGQRGVPRVVRRSVVGVQDEAIVTAYRAMPMPKSERELARVFRVSQAEIDRVLSKPDRLFR